MNTWTAFSEREDVIRRVAERAGIPRSRASALAARLASRPLPRRAAQRVLKATHGECSGCPKCDPEMRKIMRASATGDFKTYSALLSAQDVKRGLPLRKTKEADMPRADDLETYTPPDPYAKGIEKMRRAAPVRPATRDDDYTPPNPYLADLDRLRRDEENTR